MANHYNNSNLRLFKVDRNGIKRVSISLPNIHYRTLLLSIFETFNIFISAKQY